MKTEIRTVMIPQEKVFWVADDGTAFAKQCECADYELAACRKQLNASKDVVECNDALDCPPFDGGDYIENHNYRWFKPLNANGIELLNKAFPSDYAKLDNDAIDKWHCIEYSDYDTACYWYCLQNSIDYVSKMLGLLGPNCMSFIKDKDSTCMLDDFAAKTFDTSVDTPFIETGNETHVTTSIGSLIAKPYHDPNFPGIWIELCKNGLGENIALAKVEYYEDDRRLVVDVYGDALRDEVTDQIEFENYEED